MLTNESLMQRARGVMPGGVNSPVRAFRGVGGIPISIARAAGCRLVDVEGRSYVDYIGSWGAMIAGHAHPEVVESVERAVRDGFSFGTCSPPEVELASEIVRRVPSVEKVRMVNSGTEAVMSAVRLARAATGRRRVVKFAGCYHGHADALLARSGSGVATLGLPDSPGVTPGAAGDTLIARYNDCETVDRLFAEQGDHIACIVVEPLAGNMGVVPPRGGFLERLRERTRAHGALLLFDEVMTGFRVAPGGAQELYGIEPDLTTFGKVIGGGFPVGAYGGPSRLMDRLAPDGPVYQAGTLSGNPVAMSAGLATLNLLDEAAYARLERRGARLQSGLAEILAEHGVPGVVQRVGSMLTLFFTDRPVHDFDAATAANHDRFAAFFQAMLSRGVHLPPSGYEAWFLSLSHDQSAIERTLASADQAIAECND